MTTTKPAGRLLAWAALVIALGASVAANVAYAAPALGPRLSAGTAPVLVVLAAGLLERVSLAGARRWQQLLAVGGLIFVVIAAFITSYQHQRSLLLSYGNPELSSVLLPLAVDALIIMASICLAVIADRRREMSQPDDAGRDRTTPDIVETPTAVPVSAPVSPAPRTRLALAASPRMSPLPPRRPVSPRSTETTDTARDEIQRLKREGKSVPEICDMTNTSRATVYRHIQSLRETNGATLSEATS